MANRKDMRREDLIIPYQEPKAGSETPEFSSTIASTMPMAAIFMRNRYVGWASVVFSIQAWLGESEATRKAASTPGYFNVGMSVMSLVATYLPILLPSVGQATGGTSTDSAPPVPAS